MSELDDYEREAAIEAGFDPDDPKVAEALSLVKWELQMLRSEPPTRGARRPSAGG